jgi:hypothetical protein
VSYSVTHTDGPRRRRLTRKPLLGTRVWLHRGALDRALARGADTASDPRLAYRGAQLTSPRHRRALAAGLNRTTREAEEPARPFTCAVPVQRREVRAARDQIEQLARDLAGPDEVQLRGILLVRDLLTHGDSPFFTPGPDGALSHAVRHAHAALLMR